MSAENPPFPPSRSLPESIPEIKVNLDRLKGSSLKFQARRNSRHRRELEALARDIDINGVIDPPTARVIPTEPGMYELIAGHQRVAALRMLRDSAQSPEARQRYSEVLVRVHPALDDRTACRWSIADNVQRIDLDPVELSEALLGYAELADVSPEQAAEELGIPDWKVDGLVRLSTAATFIRDAVSDGLASLHDLPVSPASSIEEEQEREARRLDLRAAMDLEHVYRTLIHPDPETVLKPVIQKALLESWSTREIRKECRRLTALHKSTGGQDGTRREVQGRTAQTGRRRNPKKERSNEKQTTEQAEAPVPRQAQDTSQPTASEPEIAALADTPASESVQANPVDTSAPAPEPAQVDTAPQVALPSPAPSPTSHQNPAWEYAGDDVVFHPSRFTGLPEQHRRGACILLMNLLKELGWPGALQALASVGVKV